MKTIILGIYGRNSTKDGGKAYNLWSIDARNLKVNSALFT